MWIHAGRDYSIFAPLSQSWLPVEPPIFALHVRTIVIFSSMEETLHQVVDSPGLNLPYDRAAASRHIRQLCDRNSAFQDGLIIDFFVILHPIRTSKMSHVSSQRCTSFLLTGLLMSITSGRRRLVNVRDSTRLSLGRCEAVHLSTPFKRLSLPKHGGHEAGYVRPVRSTDITHSSPRSIAMLSAHFFVLPPPRLRSAILEFQSFHSMRLPNILSPISSGILSGFHLPYMC